MPEDNAFTPGEEAPPAAAGPEVHACPACGREFGSQRAVAVHRLRGCKGKTAEKPQTAERPPKTAAVKAAPARRRVPCAHLLGPLWSQLARLVPDVPAQRVMVWETPAAGAALDKAVAGTVVDRWVLQKIASTESKYRGAWDLLSLPIMVAAVNRQPALFPVVRPMLREAIKANLDAALDAKIVEAADDQRLRAKAEAAGLQWETDEVDPETGRPIKVDLIDRTLAEFFGPLGAEEAQPEAEQVAA